LFKRWEALKKLIGIQRKGNKEAVSSSFIDPQTFFQKPYLAPEINKIVFSLTTKQLNNEAINTSNTGRNCIGGLQSG
jgi:hypothetical protein